MIWHPEQEDMWRGQDVYVLGGGASLKQYSKALLKKRLRTENVIGCNDCYLLGDSVVNILHFGDRKWYKAHAEEIPKHFHGLITTSKECFRHLNTLFWIPRRPEGFHKNALGWNRNTGAGAINLALILGARRVFLLGFDMDLSPTGEGNWYENKVDKPDAKRLSRFAGAIAACIPSLKKNFPGVQIINLNLHSKLDCFQKMDWEMLFEEAEGQPTIGLEAVSAPDPCNHLTEDFNASTTVPTGDE